MILLFIGAALMLVSSLWLTLDNRPPARSAGGSSRWPGSAAGRFAAGLMALAYGVTALLNELMVSAELQHSQLWLQQVSLYAALPLVICTHLAERFRQHWTRQTWGRIFLGWCVVFELMRRNNLLDQLLWVCVAAGLAMLLVPWFSVGVQSFSRKQQWLNQLLPLGLWLTLAMSLRWYPLESLMSVWLGVALIALALAQPVSYALALPASEPAPDPDH